MTRPTSRSPTTRSTPPERSASNTNTHARNAALARELRSFSRSEVLSRLRDAVLWSLGDSDERVAELIAAGVV